MVAAVAAGDGCQRSESAIDREEGRGRFDGAGIGATLDEGRGLDTGRAGLGREAKGRMQAERETAGVLDLDAELDVDGGSVRVRRDGSHQSLHRAPGGIIDGELQASPSPSSQLHG